MSLTTAPAGAWKFAKCVFRAAHLDHGDDGVSKASSRDRAEESRTPPPSLGQGSTEQVSAMIIFGACKVQHESSEEDDVRSASLPLHRQNAPFYANMEIGNVVGIDAVLRSPKTWFTDDAMNLAIGSLWAGLLPQMHLRAAPSSKSPPASSATGSTCMFLSTYCWGKSVDLARAATSLAESATAARPKLILRKTSSGKPKASLSGGSADAQPKKADSGGLGKDTGKSSAKVGKGGSGSLPNKNTSAEKRGDGSSQGEVEIVQDTKTESHRGNAALFENFVEQRNYLSRVMRKIVSNTLASEEENCRASLLHAARSPGIDTLIIPGYINKNHWITVVVTGLRSLADVLLDDSETRGTPLGEASEDSDMTAKWRIAVLDSLALGAQSDGKNVKHGKQRKAKVAQSEHTAPDVASIVCHMLANEWVRSASGLGVDSAGGELFEALREKVAFFKKRVQVHHPPVPKQDDLNQCGPMAILAMEALCHDTLFRQFCLEWEDLSGDISREAPGRQVPEPYSFADSFLLRCRLLRFVEHARCVARAEVVARRH